MTVENLPIFFLVMIGIGVIIIVVGIIRLATIHEEMQDDIEVNKQEYSHHLEELFSYFLQEEEKKNQDFRDKILETSQAKQKKEEVQGLHILSKDKNRVGQNKTEKQMLDEIITRYQEGEPIEEIAKNLKKGIGEVKLVISLYSMR